MMFSFLASRPNFLNLFHWKNITISWLNCLHRSWWRMLGLECIGDKNKMLATVFAISVTNINYFFTGCKCWWHTISYIFTNIKIASLHQHQNSFTNIHESSTTSRCHQHPGCTLMLAHLRYGRFLILPFWRVSRADRVYCWSGVLRLRYHLPKIPCSTLDELKLFLAF